MAKSAANHRLEKTLRRDLYPHPSARRTKSFALRRTRRIGLGGGRRRPSTSTPLPSEGVGEEEEVASFDGRREESFAGFAAASSAASNDDALVEGVVGTTGSARRVWRSSCSTRPSPDRRATGARGRRARARDRRRPRSRAPGGARATPARGGANARRRRGGAGGRRDDATRTRRRAAPRAPSARGVRAARRRDARVQRAHRRDAHRGCDPVADRVGRGGRSAAGASVPRRSRNARSGAPGRRGAARGQSACRNERTRGISLVKMKSRVLAV